MFDHTHRGWLIVATFYGRSACINQMKTIDKSRLLINSFSVQQQKTWGRNDNWRRRLRCKRQNATWFLQRTLVERGCAWCNKKRVIERAVSVLDSTDAFVAPSSIWTASQNRLPLLLFTLILGDRWHGTRRPPAIQVREQSTGSGCCDWMNRTVGLPSVTQLLR